MKNGETFELEGKTYVAVGEPDAGSCGGCGGCAFRDDGVLCGSDYRPRCAVEGIIFVEHKPPASDHITAARALRDALDVSAAQAGGRAQAMLDMADTANPKDAAGRAKVPMHLWPASATAYGAIGLLEGELKYGRNNFRATPVAASVYVAALKRHIDAWMEGQEVATDTGSPHLGNALACLAILVDAKTNGTLIDDRNYVPEVDAYERLMTELTAQVAKLKTMFADKSPKHWDARDMGAGA